MDEFQLTENLQDIFKDLLLQESIEDEKRLLQENGVDVDETTLDEFHRKKEAFLENKKSHMSGFKKLNTEDLADVSEGALALSLVKIVSKTILKNLLNVKLGELSAKKGL